MKDPKSKIQKQGRPMGGLVFVKAFLTKSGF